MMRTHWLTKRVVVVAVGGLVAAACSSSTGDTTVSTALSSQGSDTTITAAATLILPGESIVAGLPVVDLVGPSSSGAGEYPFFGWEPVTESGVADSLMVASVEARPARVAPNSLGEDEWESADAVQQLVGVGLIDVRRAT